MRLAIERATRRFALAAALAAIASFTLAPVASPARASDLTPGHHLVRGERIRICNAIGEVSIVAGEGSDVVVDVKTEGRDGSRLRVAIDDCDGARRLRVVYPSDRIVDPDLGPNEHHETTLGGCCGKERIHFTRPGDGLDARANLLIRVPKGQRLELGLGAGSIDAEKLDARLGIDAGSASVHVKEMTGSLAVDAGSGGAVIEKFRGSLALDSGSGGVELEDCDGTLAIDSGSGGVTLSRLRSDKIAIDSGSGQVQGDDIIVASLAVDSGSGGIDLARLNAKKIVVDSGSGRVSADLVQSPTSLRIESGSGGVRLLTPRDLDARLQISCSKRRLDLQLPVVASTISNDYFEGKVGSGRGLIVIESGSGGVSVSARAE